MIFLSKRLLKNEIVFLRVKKQVYTMITTLSFGVFPFWSFVEYINTSSFDDIKTHPTYKAIKAAITANHDISVSIPVEHIIPERFLCHVLRTKSLPECMVYSGKMFVFPNLCAMFYGIIDFYEKFVPIVPEITPLLQENKISLERCVSKMNAIVKQNYLMDALQNMSL